MTSCQVKNVKIHEHSSIIIAVVDVKMPVFGHVYKSSMTRMSVTTNDWLLFIKVLWIKCCDTMLERR